MEAAHRKGRGSVSFQKKLKAAWIALLLDPPWRPENAMRFCVQVRGQFCDVVRGSGRGALHMKFRKSIESKNKALFNSYILKGSPRLKNCESYDFYLSGLVT